MGPVITGRRLGVHCGQAEIDRSGAEWAEHLGGVQDSVGAPL